MILTDLNQLINELAIIRRSCFFLWNKQRKKQVPRVPVLACSTIFHMLHDLPPTVTDYSAIESQNDLVNYHIVFQKVSIIIHFIQSAGRLYVDI